MKHLTMVVLTGLLLAIGMTAQAEKVYKWQGDDGSWHYSEMPPVEKEAETLKIKTSSPSAPSADEELASKSPVSDSEETSNEPPLEKSPEIVAAEREYNTQNCERARKNLKSLTDRPRIRYMDKEKGEERYLTPKEHDEWSQKSKGQVKEFCQ